MPNIDLTAKEYEMIQSALSFLDQDDTILENLETSEDGWQALLSKFEVSAEDVVRK